MLNSSIEYGLRTVPVEMGSHYLSDDSGQKLMTVNDFIDTCVLNASNVTGYIAQHDIFAQITNLRRDIIIPDYCTVLPTAENKHIRGLEDEHQPSSSNSDEVITQIWFGPVGTYSPLHLDPYHNMLVQVVGRFKYCTGNSSLNSLLC